MLGETGGILISIVFAVYLDRTAFMAFLISFFAVCFGSAAFMAFRFSSSFFAAIHRAFDNSTFGTEFFCIGLDLGKHATSGRTLEKATLLATRWPAPVLAAAYRNFVILGSFYSLRRALGIRSGLTSTNQTCSQQTNDQ